MGNQGRRGPAQTKNIGSAGTQAPYPSRPEHATTPPWIEVPGDPPLPRVSPQLTGPEAPRQRRFNFAGPRAPEWMSGPLGAAAREEPS
jgi:hypothetical protein